MRPPGSIRHSGGMPLRRNRVSLADTASISTMPSPAQMIPMAATWTRSETDIAPSEPGSMRKCCGSTPRITKLAVRALTATGASADTV